MKGRGGRVLENQAEQVWTSEVHRVMDFSCVCVCVLSCVRLFATPVDRLQPTSLLCPWDFPGKNTGVDAFIPLGDLHDPGIESVSPVSPALLAYSLPPGKPPVKQIYIQK